MTKEYFIFLKGEDKSAQIQHCTLENENLKVIFKNNPQTYIYQKQNFRLLKRATSNNFFNYLKELCSILEIQTSEGALNVLLKEYEKIQTIAQESALYIYCNPESLMQTSTHTPPLIFPFGANNSQYQAVQNAISQQISIIEGPPGRAKHKPF
ncbi:hypothetical protein [Helicobacter mesocricetorum]|uniref:hypothetical protein n=1 Tax=Helicobacter mesocricetorum TaxID=87012 RepID=UPI000CF029FE|nr:hypothetical protein [Helicobacter mesocricetorum]